MIVVTAALLTPALASAGTTYYAIGKPVCRVAKKDALLPVCLVEKRALVKKGAKGARAIRLASGAIGNGTQGPAGA